MQVLFKEFEEILPLTDHEKVLIESKISFQKN